MQWEHTQPPGKYIAIAINTNVTSSHTSMLSCIWKKTKFWFQARTVMMCNNTSYFVAMQQLCYLQCQQWLASISSGTESMSAMWELRTHHIYQWATEVFCFLFVTLQILTFSFCQPFFLWNNSSENNIICITINLNNILAWQQLASIFYLNAAHCYNKW